MNAENATRVSGITAAVMNAGLKGTGLFGDFEVCFVAGSKASASGGLAGVRKLIETF